MGNDHPAIHSLPNPQKTVPQSHEKKNINENPKQTITIPKSRKTYINYPFDDTVCVCYEYNANHKAHNTYCATFLSSPLNILYVQCELETTTSTHNITLNKFAIEIFLSRLSFSFDDAFFVKKINRNQFLSIREGKKR